MSPGTSDLLDTKGFLFIQFLSRNTLVGNSIINNTFMSNDLIFFVEDGTLTLTLDLLPPKWIQLNPGSKWMILQTWQNLLKNINRISHSKYGMGNQININHSTRQCKVCHRQAERWEKDVGIYTIKICIKFGCQPSVLVMH